jgi:hypothetical protein
VLAYKRIKKPMERERERYFRTEPPKVEEKRGKKKEIGEILQGSKRKSSLRLLPSDPRPCASNLLFHHPWLDPSIFEFAALNFIVVQDNEILMYVSL